MPPRSLVLKRPSSGIRCIGSVSYTHLDVYKRQVLLCLVGSFRNLTFLPVIIINTLIGIIQEIRAKNTLEKLSMLNAPHANVVRDGKTLNVDSEELVLDDIVLFKAGNQICADAIVVDGEVQVNESLLTGESDEITKKPGDHLMSGSFVVAGQCFSRLEAVGEDSYISKLTLEAKAMQKGEQSEICLLYTSKEEGIEAATKRINRLNKCLIQDERFDDLRRSAEDADYQKRLIEEYNIE